MLEQEINPQFDPDAVSLKRRLVTHGVAIGGLLCTTIFFRHLQIEGVTAGWTPALRAIGESLEHPLPGYTGAAAGCVVAAALDSEHEGVYELAGTTIGNFSAEIGQSILTPESPATNFIATRNLPETGKDYLFALLGGLFFVLNEKLLKRKK